MTVRPSPRIPVTIVNTAPTATVSLSDTGPGTDDTLIATASRAMTTVTACC